MRYYLDHHLDRSNKMYPHQTICFSRKPIALTKPNPKFDHNVDVLCNGNPSVLLYRFSQFAFLLRGNRGWIHNVVLKILLTTARISTGLPSILSTNLRGVKNIHWWWVGGGVNKKTFVTLPLNFTLSLWNVCYYT